MSSLKVGMRSRYLFEQPERVLIGEILELDDHVREDLASRRHEFLDQVVVGGAVQPRLLQAEVQRVAAQLGVVGPDIEQDRQAQVGMHARACRIDRELADRDAHAVRAEIAQAENALAVGHHDDGDVAPGPVGEDLPDAAAIARADEDAAGRWKMWPYCWHARPTVGVYTIGSISSG
jgi:hypothetical protein